MLWQKHMGPEVIWGWLHIVARMNVGAASIFIVILVLGLFVNKYVLSVLGFKYPTIFQVKGLLLLSYLFLIFTAFFFSSCFSSCSFFSSLNFLLRGPPPHFLPSPLPATPPPLNLNLNLHQGWQTLCGLLLYKILTVAAKSNFKVTNLNVTYY